MLRVCCSISKDCSGGEIYSFLGLFLFEFLPHPNSWSTFSRSQSCLLKPVPCSGTSVSPSFPPNMSNTRLLGAIGCSWRFGDNQWSPVVQTGAPSWRILHWPPFLPWNLGSSLTSLYITLHIQPTRKSWCIYLQNIQNMNLFVKFMFSKCLEQYLA